MPVDIRNFFGPKSSQDSHGSAAKTPAKKEVREGLINHEVYGVLLFENGHFCSGLFKSCSSR